MRCIIISTNTSEEATDNETLQVYSSNEYSLTANGQLLESESSWYSRPKITYDEENKMVFRPLRMKCTHCDEAYTKTHDLYAHIRTHQNHTKCPFCQRTLTCMATFVYHVRTHTSEKPYYCPVDGCNFKNAVKYNLKVHLACIRHGGKSNLKKFAKVLDLDVCDKSLRKRKDNSVHELGSRRSIKKRKKLNNGRSEHQHIDTNYKFEHQYPPYLKQEELYDPNYAAQLLLSLSSMPPIPDFTQNVMPYSMNNHIIPLPPIDNINDIGIKSEKQEVDNQFLLKPETYYDPIYAYYPYPAQNNTLSTTTTNTIDAPTPANLSWYRTKEENIDINTENNSDALLVPKQEPLNHFNAYYTNTTTPSSEPPTNGYYINGYYNNFNMNGYVENANLLYPPQITLQNENENDNNNNNNNANLLYPPEITLEKNENSNNKNKVDEVPVLSENDVSSKP